MSDTFKIVHVCEHSIPQTSKTTETISVQRAASGDTDTVNLSRIDRVLLIETTGFCRFPDVHFQLSGQNKIKWICPEVIRPAASSTYLARVETARAIQTSFDPDNCERCGGNGWYVGVISNDDASMALTTGTDKLVQDFMKVLLTDSRSYINGTALRSVLGATMSANGDEIKSVVTLAIREAEDTIKKMQYKMILDGTEIADDEILHSVITRRIDIPKDIKDIVYVELALMTKSNFSVSIGLNVG